MKKNSKTVVSVDVSNVRTRNTWGSVKPYTRVEMPKTAYKGERAHSSRRAIISLLADWFCTSLPFLFSK